MRAKELGLDPLSLPRLRKVHGKYDYSGCCASSQYEAASAEALYKSEYFQIIDSALVDLKEYSSSTDLNEYNNLTNSLLTDTIAIGTLSKYP